MSVFFFICGNWKGRTSPQSHFDGTDYENYRRDHISFISQNYDIRPGTTVLENVVSALRLSGKTKKEAGQRAEEILQEVELWQLHYCAAKLSSDQKQRVAIARALARQPKVIFADEPTGNLDEDNTLKICSLLRRISKHSLVVMVTHEQRLANFFADRIITMDDGVIREDITEWDRQGLQAERGKTVYAGDYEETQIQADARTIVTVTIIVLAMVMLYRLCRARTQQRLGMLAVYRLLGIPNRKLAAIFALESLLASVTTAAPAAGLTWLQVRAAKLVPQWTVSMLLPWQAAVLTYLAIAVYHILVTLLPLGRLLRMPPARLAAKYDI